MFPRSSVISLSTETVSLHVSPLSVSVPIASCRPCSSRRRRPVQHLPPSQMAAAKASGAAGTCQNNLLRQVSDNCLGEPRRRWRVPALPERKQISSFSGGRVEGPAPKHNRNRKRAARRSEQTADDKRFHRRDGFSLLPRRG